GGQPDEALAVVDRLRELAEAHPDDDAPRQLYEMFLGNALVFARRLDEAEPVIRQTLASTEPGTLRDFWPSTILADTMLQLGRPAEAVQFYGRAMWGLLGTEMVTGEVLQAWTVARALADLGRLEDAATVLGVCGVGQRDLAWQPFGGLVELVDSV